MRWIVVALVCATCLVEVSHAQDRREMFEGLLKNLIESQLQQRDRDSGRGRDRDPDDNRGRPGFPDNERRPGFQNPQLVSARQLFVELSNNCASLVTSLRVEERTTPQVRPLLADALTLHASADILSRQAQQTYRLDALATEFQSFDRSWRVLSHRLKQVTNLGRPTQRVIDQIAATDGKLCELLGIQPQLDRSELLRLSAIFTTHFQSLLSDLKYERQRDRNWFNLVQEGERLFLKIRQTMSLIESGSYESIVNGYKECQSDWQTYAGNLRRANYPRLQRHILNIEETGRAIAEQLWLPVPTDRPYVLQLAQTVASDVDRLLQSVSLKELINVRNPTALIGSAKEFSEVSQNFVRSAERVDRIEDLAWDFRIFEVQWNEFGNQLRGIASPDVLSVIADLDRNFELLQAALHLQPSFDRREMTQLASRLDEFCNQLQQQADRIVRSGAYPSQFRTEFRRNTDALHDAAHELHDQLYKHGADSQIWTASRKLVSEWTTFKTLLTRCNAQDQQVLLQTVVQVEPLMVKLQVVFTD